MNTMEAIRTRRSYRGNFKNTPVPREHLKQILEAGVHAPSGCNKQTTSFIAVDDPELMKQLHAVIDPPVGETAPAMVCVLTKKNLRLPGQNLLHSGLRRRHREHAAGNHRTGLRQLLD